MAELTLFGSFVCLLIGGITGVGSFWAFITWEERQAAKKR